jgi:hypothetical protein
MNKLKTDAQLLQVDVSRSLLDNICGSIYNEIHSLVYDDEFEQYDEASGFRITKKTVACEPPKLNDVLKWHSSNGRDKYSHFEVSKGEAYFLIYNGEETESVIWDLSKVNLHEQSNELIEWLADLV